MTYSQLLSGKFMAEKLPDICAPRHALLNRFRREADKSVIFISSPAGYGKTVSTLLWLADCGREVIWMRLDDYDNAPHIFYKLFCTGIAAIQPNNKAMADILKQPSFSSAPVEHAIALLSEFIPDGKQYALVIDDMHLITNKEIRKSGLLVQKRLPASFVTLILTRNEIAQEYIDVVGEDKVAVIDQNDLAFSALEIQKYFNDYGRSITTQEAESVHAVTNGWAIGVNALAMSGQIELGKNSGRIFEDYIRVHVWDKWDEELQNFMLKTSITDAMTVTLAKMLTGCENSRDILEELCAKNSFISHVGEDAYRYHPLFLEFLRSLKASDNGINKSALYKIAAEYYTHSGDYLSARRFAIFSGDADAINASYSMMNSGKSICIDDYVNFYKSLADERLSDSICRKYPYMYSTYVWYHFITGNAQKLEHNMNMLQKNLPDIIKLFPRFAQLATLVTALDHRISVSEKINAFKNSFDISKLRGGMRGTSITMQMPYAHRSMIDFHELSDESIMLQAADCFGPLLGLRYNVILALMKSGILYEQSQLKEAFENIRQVHGSLSGSRDEVVFCSFIHLASIYAAMKNESMLAETLRQTEEYIDQNGFYFFRPNFMAYKSKIGLMDSDKAVARAWLDNYFVTEAEQLELYKIFQHFTTARAYIVLAQTDAAMNYILKLKRLGMDFNRPMDIAEAMVLQAVLEWAVGNKKEALLVLEEALTAMQEYGFIRIFADEGASILPLLKRLTSSLKQEGYQGKLNAQFLHQVTIAAYEQSKRWRGIAANIRAGKPIRLSKQQRVVINLLAQGYKNADIAQATGLTIHTVKSHCAAAYKKLDVGNAMDAVLKAKEQGMIE